MSVQQASQLDKDKIVEFCQKTFSWGDYIDQIWDYWDSEGNLLVIHENNLPIAMCHASLDTKNQNLWIEGIRVNPDYRRKNYATNLVSHCEKIARSKKFKTTQMLIETTNSNSILLAQKLGYTNKETWNFYTLDNQIQEKQSSVTHLLNSKREEFLLNSKLYFVDSWRWFPLTKDSVSQLSKEDRIIFSENNNTINGIAIFTESQHFKNTVIVTLLMGDDIGIQNLLSKILSISKQQNFKRIQILTKLKNLPEQMGLEKKLTFHLFEKIYD